MTIKEIAEEKGVAVSTVRKAAADLAQNDPAYVLDRGRVPKNFTVPQSLKIKKQIDLRLKNLEVARGKRNKPS